MSVIALPTFPLPQSVNPKPLDYGGWQEPIAGGVTTRLDRLGNRFSIDVTMPRMRPEPTGRIWVSALLKSVGSLAQIVFPQPGLDIGSPGPVAVNGAAQAGSSIVLKNFAAGYTIRDGQFFNLTDGISYHLHAGQADVVADGSGNATIPIWPMLRSSPVADSRSEWTTPSITGRLTGNENGWTLERAGTRGLQSTITEVRC